MTKLSTYSSGQPFSGTLVVRECSIRQASNNKNYLALRLTDGETDITGRVWDHTGGPPAVNSVIFVKSNLGEYKGQPQLSITGWRQARPDEYSPADFLPVCPVDREELKKKLREHIENVRDPGLSQLLNTLFKGDKEFVKSYLNAPAAVYHHHAYLGGLLHHTVGVIDRCLSLATPETDADLLVVGAILHDVGKIYDYDWSGLVINMTGSGRLLGHITQGIMLVDRYAKNCSELSPGRLNLLLHLIASHHGKLEWGSPVEPCTLEAVLLHQADYLDMQLFKLELARNQVPEGETWGKVPGFSRQFWFGGGAETEGSLNKEKV